MEAAFVQRIRHHLGIMPRDGGDLQECLTRCGDGRVRRGVRRNFARNRFRGSSLDRSGLDGGSLAGRRRRGGLRSGIGTLGDGDVATGGGGLGRWSHIGGGNAGGGAIRVRSFGPRDQRS